MVVPLPRHRLLRRDSFYTGGARAAGGSRMLGQCGRGRGYEQLLDGGRLLDLHLCGRWLARWFLG